MKIIVNKENELIDICKLYLEEHLDRNELISSFYRSYNQTVHSSIIEFLCEKARQKYNIVPFSKQILDIEDLV